jgi:hypothetical protein
MKFFVHWSDGIPWIKQRSVVTLRLFDGRPARTGELVIIEEWGFERP